MSNDENLRRRLLLRFAEEVSIKLKKFRQNLDQLENNLESVEPDLLQEIFRAVHTIKGSARMLDLREIGDLAHEMENVAGDWRILDLKPDLTAVQLFREAAAAIEHLTNLHVQNDSSTPGYSQVFRQAYGAAAATRYAIADYLKGQGFDTRTVNYKPRPGLIGLEQQERHILGGKFATIESQQLYELSDLAWELKNLSESLSRSWESLKSSIDFQQLSNQAETEPSSFYEDWSALILKADRENYAQISRLLPRWRELQAAFEQKLDALGRTTFNVGLYAAFPVAVHRLAQQGNIEVNLKLEGGELKADRRLLEFLRDPLMMVVGNALGFGESPTERILAGKPPARQLIITARREDKWLELSVSDDSEGIDPERVRETAVRRGIMTEEQARATSDDEIINLIYEPKYSTAPILKVFIEEQGGIVDVKTHLEKLGGQIRVVSKVGQGTTVTMRVPDKKSVIATDSDKQT